jgi:hypothetical protein
VPNNKRTHTDASAIWADGYTPPPSDWEDLERKIFGSWNGDKGGAYCARPGAQGDPYVFTGSGLKVTGPTRLSYGGQVLGGSGAFVIRDGAWPQLDVGHVGRSRSIVCPIHGFSIPSDAPRLLGIGGDSWKSPTYLWSRRTAPYLGIGSVALACRQTTSRKIETAPIYIDLRVIDGATLEKVTLFFRVATKRAFAPIAMPKMRVLRVPKDSGDAFQTVVPEPLKDTTDGLGFDFLPLVTSPDDWYNGGAVQSFEYICDQNHEIDCDSYHYVVHIVEEAGALSADDDFDGIRLVERKQDCTFWIANSATLSGDQSTDGTTTGTTGVRVLVTDSDDVIDYGYDPLYGGALATKNGIWLTNASTWTRANDCDDTEDFTQNWIVRVNSGGRNMNSSWQCLHPAKNQRITLGGATGGADATFARPRLEPALPKGNIYHALVPTFHVSDLRFQ